jgi:hypothetical protein
VDRPIVHALRGVANETYSSECVEGEFSKLQVQDPA